jgi:hypothetical protein
MSEVKTSITYEDRTAYQDGIRIGIERGRRFERSEIMRILDQLRTTMANIEIGGYGPASANMPLRVKTIDLIIEKIKEKK